MPMDRYPRTVESLYVEVTYANGDVEHYPIELDGGYCTNGEYAHSLNRAPNHIVEASERCSWASDDFMYAIGDGGERSGSVTPDEFEYADEEGAEPFKWRIVGSEADLCREKMAYWLDRLRPDEVLAMPSDSDLDPADKRRLYDDIRSYWSWMNDPVAELEQMVASRSEASPAP
ncbi:hypothetical protein [Jiella sp. M17.18]|uniref:hypothetical protein n=1 Tax=Jiella sp. M17.18 TaxID=3234247 RepID=UPI0034DF7C4A